MKLFKKNILVIYFLIHLNKVCEISGSKNLWSKATRANIDEFGNDIPCGIVNRNPEPKIVGGEEAQPNEFPWLVSLQVKIRNEYKHNCGGSIVNKDYILTAGHCTDGVRTQDIQIAAGKFNINVAEAHQQIREVEKIFQDNFNAENYENDIALIKLKDSLKLEDGYVAPVCIPKGGEKFDNVTEAAGWGRLKENGELPDKTHKVALPLIDPKVCRDIYEEKGYEFFLHRCQICTLSKEEKNTCQGDSGGPLMCTIGGDDTKLYACGVGSWGSSCKNNDPGVYTEVSCYYDWIKKTVNK